MKILTVRIAREIARNLEQLKGKEPIASGMFCQVYDAGPDHVMKLTCDEFAYEYMCGPFAPKGIKFPRSEMLDWDCGSFTRVNKAGKKRDFNTWLVLQERLMPVKLADEDTRRQARKLLKELRSAKTTEDEDQITNFLNQYNEGPTLDYGMQNLMVRKTGEVVIVDPICNGVAVRWSNEQRCLY